MFGKKRTFVNPINGDELRIDSFTRRKYLNLLKLAATSKPTPDQSGYFVYTAGLTRSGIMVAGSNHEHGLTDTVTHGEESVIDHALEKAGRDDPIRVIAFASEHEGGIPRPCGNCRDALKEYSGTSFVMIAGNPDQGVVSVVSGLEYYHDIFSQLITFGIESRNPAFYEALTAARQSVSIYSPNVNVYGAAISTEAGIFRGTFRSDAAYHAVAPISAAISNWRDGSRDPDRIKLRELVIVAEGTNPNVIYKERQHLLEFVDSINAYLDQDYPLPIRIYQVGTGTDTIIYGWKTDSTEWLPYPFSPAKFGMQDKLKLGIERLLNINYNKE